MKYLEIGDGITWGKIHPDASKEIHKLLEDKGYEMYLKTSQRKFSVEDSFIWNGKYWLTCHINSIENPLSYEQIKSKILGHDWQNQNISESNYEIY